MTDRMSVIRQLVPKESCNQAEANPVLPVHGIGMMHTNRSDYLRT